MFSLPSSTKSPYQLDNCKSQFSIVSQYQRNRKIFAPRGTPDYDPRYWSQAYSNEDVNRYPKDGFDNELLNINITPITTDYQTFLNDSFNSEILEINLGDIIN
uniref:Uncharacterized protein n=1 Tax=Glossina palpalis gambiensis TaxID=67801 RepID=A0A1B0BNR3_9MUSC